MKKIYFLLFLLGTNHLRGVAQSLGLGASVNSLSNGIHAFYAAPLNKNWDWEGGLRIMVNTFSLNENKQHYLFYQNGYAMDFPEYFGLNFRLSRKIIGYKMFRLDAMANLLATRHSLLQKGEVPIEDSNGQFYLADNVNYYPPGISLDLTLGLKLKVELNKKITLMAASGLGINYLYYSLKGWSRTFNVPVQAFTGSATKHNYEFVGLDGLPMMFVGATYSIGSCKSNKKNSN